LCFGDAPLVMICNDYRVGVDDDVFGDDPFGEYSQDPKDGGGLNEDIREGKSYLP